MGTALWGHQSFRTRYRTRSRWHSWIPTGILIMCWNPALWRGFQNIDCGLGSGRFWRLDRVSGPYIGSCPLLVTSGHHDPGSRPPPTRRTHTQQDHRRADTEPERTLNNLAQPSPGQTPVVLSQGHFSQEPLKQVLPFSGVFRPAPYYAVNLARTSATTWPSSDSALMQIVFCSISGRCSSSAIRRHSASIRCFAMSSSSSDLMDTLDRAVMRDNAVTAPTDNKNIAEICPPRREKSRSCIEVLGYPSSRIVASSDRT